RRCDRTARAASSRWEVPRAAGFPADYVPARPDGMYPGSRGEPRRRADGGDGGRHWPGALGSGPPQRRRGAPAIASRSHLLWREAILRQLDEPGRPGPTAYQRNRRSSLQIERPVGLPQELQSALRTGRQLVPWLPQCALRDGWG